MEREYISPLDPSDEFSWIMTVDEFKETILSQDWGHGYWVRDNKESRDRVFSTPQLDATHVSWYNK